MNIKDLKFKVRHPEGREFELTLDEMIENEYSEENVIAVIINTKITQSLE